MTDFAIGLLEAYTRMSWTFILFGWGQGAAPSFGYSLIQFVPGGDD